MFVPPHHFTILRPAAETGGQDRAAVLCLRMDPGQLQGLAVGGSVSTSVYSTIEATHAKQAYIGV